MKPVTGNFKLSSLVLKKDTNLLIATGQRNPISVGIDYKAASVIMDAGGPLPGHGWRGQAFLEIIMITTTKSPNASQHGGKAGTKATLKRRIHCKCIVV